VALVLGHLVQGWDLIVAVVQQDHLVLEQEVVVEVEQDHLAQDLVQ